MKDPFDNHARTIGQPADDAFPITPSDTQSLTIVTRALYIGTGGNITVKMKRGTVVTFTAVPSATILPVRIIEVLQTNTTAGNIVGLL